MHVKFRLAFVGACATGLFLIPLAVHASPGVGTGTCTTGPAVAGRESVVVDMWPFQGERRLRGRTPASVGDQSHESALTCQ